MPTPRPSFALVAHVAGAPVWDGAYPPGYRYAPHCDHAPRVSIVLQGALREEARGTDETATAASVVVKPADVRHRNEFGPVGARLLSVALTDGLAPGLDRWRWHHAGPVGAAALQFARSVRHVPAEAEDALWSLLEALGGAVDHPEAVAPWLLRAKERMDDEGPGASSVADLAAEADVHPVSLARAFRRAFGCAPTAYRRRLRVRRAADLLASTDAPAAQVALEAGFADQSHMCRDVRADLGLTPGQLRAAGA